MENNLDLEQLVSRYGYGAWHRDKGILARCEHAGRDAYITWVGRNKDGLRVGICRSNRMFHRDGAYSYTFVSAAEIKVKSVTIWE